MSVDGQANQLWTSLLLANRAGLFLAPHQDHAGGDRYHAKPVVKYKMRTECNTENCDENDTELVDRCQTSSIGPRSGALT